MLSLRPAPPFLADFLMRAEALKLEAYQDSKGVWTIGVGHTGPEVVQGLVITRDVAMIYLQQDMAVAAQRLASVVSAARIAALTENQYAALLSFVFNLGVNSQWTIFEDVNGGNLADVPAQMDRFDRYHDAKGVVQISAGLAARRKAEEHMFETPDPLDKADLANAPPMANAVINGVDPADVPSSGMLSASTTPPRPLAGVSHALATMWATAIGFVMMLPNLLKEAVDALSPYSSSDYVAKAITVLTTVGAAAALAAFLYAKRTHQLAKN